MTNSLVSTALSVVPTWAWDTVSEKASELAAKWATAAVEKGAESIIEKVKSRWKLFKSDQASLAYKSHLLTIIGTTKVLGNQKSIDIRKIYTDVFFHEKINAQRRFPGDLRELAKASLDSIPATRRVSAAEVAAAKSNLYILGKPGAGKTTFLKYLAVQECAEGSSRTPIFVSLKEWSDSSLSLLDFIERSFLNCGFSDALDVKAFVHSLLDAGKALVLLDGLDEINEWQSKRSIAIDELVSFANRYLCCQICLTCRVAATDYSFNRFDYVEIADFNRIQQRRFITQWFDRNNPKLPQFLRGWRNSHQRGLREIGRTPLLLALICLAYEETLEFPARRVDLYKEALEALLKKWDTSRNIRRDDFYKGLPASRKEQLLEYIAARYFLNEKQVFTETDVAERTLEFLKQLPDTREARIDNAKSVVTAIAAQHGLIVERVAGVYSFSHLTFQEFFTARYITHVNSEKLIESIAERGIFDQKWREVIIFTASLLPSADTLFIQLLKNLQKIRNTHQGLRRLLSVLHAPIREQKQALARVERSLPLTTAEFRKVTDHVQAMWRFLENRSRTDYGVLQERTKKINDLLKKRPQFAAELLGGYSADPDSLLYYLYGCRLIIECLEVSMTSKRGEVVSQVLA